MKFFFTYLIMLYSLTSLAQAKLIINGGIISINNGAILVIDNPDNTAITQTGSGYIVSEGENNRVIWSVGTGNTNTYILPFGNSSNYLPLSFSAALGSAGGKMIFSTYPTPTWKNSDYLPAGVTNVNSGGVDNSAKVIDRFWQIGTTGYSTKPTVSNLKFTYSDAEYSSPNTITESNLIPQRWNNVLNTWSDYFPGSVINTINNTITVASVPGNQIYNWWTMVDASSLLPVSLISFKAMPDNQQVITSWETASENNTSHFELWRSKNLSLFDSLGTVSAAGTSTSILKYSFNDHHPYEGISYYKLKMVDLDGKFKWSATAKVIFGNNATVLLYPNPASNTIIISLSSNVADQKPIAFLYDAKGSLLQSFKITGVNQHVYIGALAKGQYHIKLLSDNKIQILPFIKN